MREQASGDRRRQQAFSRGDHADGVDELVGRRVLEDEAGRSCSQRFHDVFVELVGRDDQDLVIGEAAGCLDSVESWHADVHEDHVGAGVVDDVNGLESVAGLRDDLDSASFEQRFEAGADQLLVVYDHHSQRVGHRGSTAWSL